MWGVRPGLRSLPIRLLNLWNLKVGSRLRRRLRTLDPDEGKMQPHIIPAFFSISRFQISRWMSVVALLTIFILPAFSLSDEEEDKCCCTTFDTGQCLMKVRKNVGAKLNDTYQRALKKWADDPSVIAKLKNAERAWIKYRDANCEGKYQ